MKPQLTKGTLEEPFNVHKGGFKKTLWLLCEILGVSWGFAKEPNEGGFTKLP